MIYLITRKAGEDADHVFLSVEKSLTNAVEFVKSTGYELIKCSSDPGIVDEPVVYSTRSLIPHFDSNHEHHMRTLRYYFYIHKIQLGDEDINSVSDSRIALPGMIKMFIDRLNTDYKLRKTSALLQKIQLSVNDMCKKEEQK